MLKTETEYLQRIADNIVHYFCSTIQVDICKKYGVPPTVHVKEADEQYRASYDTLREYGAEMRQKGRFELMQELRAKVDRQGIDAGSAFILGRSEPDPEPDKSA